jgi:hypothetical protein
MLLLALAPVRLPALNRVLKILAAIMRAIMTVPQQEMRMKFQKEKGGPNGTGKGDCDGLRKIAESWRPACNGRGISPRRVQCVGNSPR